MAVNAEFAIYDGDELFAEVSGERERAWCEAMGYASQVDNPRIEEVTRRPAPMGELPPPLSDSYAGELTEAAQNMLDMIRGSDFDGLSWSEYLGDEGAAVLSALAAAVAANPSSTSGVDGLKVRRTRAIGTAWDIAPTRHADTGGKGECDICRQMVGAWFRWNCAQACDACWQASTPERWSWSAAATASIR
jgi:hypothetical protein